MKVKTVEDAYKHIELGFLNESNWGYVCFAEHSGMYFVSSGNICTPVCTRQEFEDYAKMMELNKLNNKGQSDAPTISYISTEEYRDFNFDVDAFNVEFAKSWVENNIQFTGVKEAVKPVYTHELMVRGGVNVKEQYEPVVKVFSGDKFSVYKNENGKEYVRKNSKVKIRKIDTRTDKEKLIDEVAKLLRNMHNENLGLVKSPDLFNLNAKLIIQEVNKLK